MVKNLPTVERSTKIRFGKNCTDDQGENSIVFNASNVQIDTSTPGAVYMTPVRQQTDILDTHVKIITYNTLTKEVMNSNVSALDIFAATRDDVSSNTMIFKGEPAFITYSTTSGISNIEPTHTLDVGSNLYIDDTGDTILGVTGNTYTSRALNVGSNVVIDDLASDVIYVTGNVRMNSFTTDLTSKVGLNIDQLSNVNLGSLSEDQLLVYDGSKWVNEYNLHNFIKVHNTTGSTLYKGNTVYIVDSFNNNVANVALAKSNSSSTMPAIGLIHENIADGQEGTAVAYGKVNGIDTTGYTEGQTVYVSNVGAGLVMNTKPYGLNDKIQNVGICIKAHKSNGVIFVTGVGRSNDIPNAPISSSPNYVYVNETNNDMKKIAPENLLTKLQTLEQVVNTGNTVSNSIEINGNVNAIRFIGDGSYLTNVPSTFEQIIINGNVSSNTVEFNNTISIVTSGAVGIANSAPEHDLSVGSNLYMDDTGSNVIHVDGNVYATRFIGDGSFLENVASTLDEIVTKGNVTTQTVHIENVVSLTTTGNVGIANTNPTCHLAIGSNVCFNDTSSNILSINGNIFARQISLDSISIASSPLFGLDNITQVGNTSSSTVEFTNPATGLVTTANVGIANANPVHTFDVGSNLWIDDTGSNVLYVNGNVHVAGAQFTTERKLGISNTNPQHDLSVSSNLYVDDDGSDVLVVHGNALFGSTITLGAIQMSVAYNLEGVTREGNSTSNTIQFTNTDVGAIINGGVVVNSESYKCKHYAYSNMSVPVDFSNVAMTFSSNVFHAKITAQLTHANEEVSTMILDVQGGTRDGTTSSLNIATGPGSVFGNTNTKPWNGTVSTTPTKVILEPSATGTTAYGVDIYVEYKSSSPEGKLESISIGNDTLKSFVY
jgi:hypothetical protein